MDVRWVLWMDNADGSLIPASAPHSLSIPGLCCMSHFLPLSFKTGCTIQRKNLLIAFSCRCFSEGVVPQAERRVLWDKPYMLNSAVKPYQGKCIRVERCWKCRQPCRDTWKSHNWQSINKCMEKAFFLMDEKPLTFQSTRECASLCDIYHILTFFLYDKTTDQ